MCDTSPSRLPGDPVVRWLTVDAVEPHWVGLLDPGERARWEVKRTGAERARFLGAAVLMRRLLAQRAGCAVEEVALDRTCDCGEPHGRPVPVGRATGWHVSASHSGPFVLVAVAARPIGVDVELVRGQLPSEALLRRVLAPGEASPTSAAGFAALWSAKEAYVKALGTGLTTPLRTVELGADGAVASGAGSPRGRLRELIPPVPVPPARAHLCVLD